METVLRPGRDKAVAPAHDLQMLDRRERWAAALLLLGTSCAREGSASSAVVVHIPPAPESAAPPPWDDPSADPTALLGRWSGVGRQAGGAPYEVSVDLESLTPGICAHVHYPSLPCSAEWTCTGLRRGVLHARESLTDGQDACVDAGEITLSFTRDGRASWLWAAPGATARAVLTRATQAP